MAETKEQPQKINNLENEIKQLRLQLHKIEEQIHQKNAELSTVMAQSVSIADINEILDLQRNISDISMDNMERKDSTDAEVTPSPRSAPPKSSKKKKKKKAGDKKRKATQIWKELETQVKDGKINNVKKLIQLNKVKINDNTQWNGRTILMMASEHGQYNICSMLINLGADVTMTTKYDSTRDATYFAHKMGHYHIERLLLISSFGGQASNKINEMIERLKKQQAMNEYFIKTVVEKKTDEDTNVHTKWAEQMCLYLCQLIQNKMVFSDDMLSLCWNYNVYKYKKQALNSDLWKVIIASCTDVIQSRDSNNWYWFKDMLKSTIWLQPNPEKDVAVDAGNDEQLSLDNLLIQKLFDVTNTQSIKNGEKLKKMEKKFNVNWKSLINFDIETKYDDSPRQDDIPNGLTAKYNKEELSQNINPSTTFNALKHYDINQYLPNLVLVCHMIDDEFQQCIMDTFDINAATNTNVSDFYSKDAENSDNQNLITYRRGPIKQIFRCKAKAENDYRTMRFPTSSHLLDVIRCTLTFENVDTLLKSLKEFENKVNNNECGVFKEIVRVKNGFKTWDSKNPNYCDIKLNVIIQTEKHYAVIGEIQFLLRDISNYKLVSHKLYSVTRLDEEYLSLLKIKPIMMDHEKCLLNASSFNDSKQISNLMVVHQKDIKYIQQFIDLKRVCETRGFKLLKMLKQYMNKEELILKLKSCGGFQTVCSLGYIDMIQYIYTILPSKTNKYNDMLRNGLAEVINEGHFEILTWMFTENKKNQDFKFLKLWNEFDVSDKNAFFRRVCELGKTNCAKLLLRHFGAMFDPNDQSNDGYCALMKAVRKERIETVKWLTTLKYIDLFAENPKKGRICLFEAIDVGCFEIGDILLSEYQKQGRDPKQMLSYKANFGHTIQIFVKNSGIRGSKREEAIKYVKKWASQYDVVELQIIDFDTKNIKFASM